MKSDYGVYKGDEFLTVGTAEECAEYLKVKIGTIRFCASPTYKRRIEKRGYTNSAVIVFRLDGKEED